MFKILLFLITFSIFQLYPVRSQNDPEMIRQIFDEALVNGEAYENLRFLTKEIGGRLSGSPQAAAAVEWSRQVMRNYQFDSVFLQEVMVPRWVRGDVEIGRITRSKMGTVEVNVTALGNSVGTGPEGVSARVIEVQNFRELAELGKDAIRGKIVFFNRPMDPAKILTFRAYGGAVDQRGSGPSEAAKYGAVGAIVRSMTLASDDVPHTGSTNYKLNIPKIPAVAISTKDADLLSKLLSNDPDLEFYFETHCKMLEDVLSYNVVGELKGTEKTEEYIVVGGHLDSWDLGEGAHDDGTGCVQSIEVLRIFKALDYQPKHTIRAVMFMNEENGLRGGMKYADLAEKNNEKHIAAIESDAGGFTPRGFGISAKNEIFMKIKNWSPLFEDYGVFMFVKGGGGADISPLRTQGVPLIGFLPDSQRYFDYHHAKTDVFEQVNQRELAMGAATIASLIYLIDKYGL